LPATQTVYEWDDASWENIGPGQYIVTAVVNTVDNDFGHFVKFQLSRVRPLNAKMYEPVPVKENSPYFVEQETREESPDYVPEDVNVVTDTEVQEPYEVKLEDTKPAKKASSVKK
jgi:hypothetical protein